MPKDSAAPEGEPEFVDWNPGGDAASWSPALEEQAEAHYASPFAADAVDMADAVGALADALIPGRHRPPYPPGSPEGGPTGDPTFMDWDGNQQRAREGGGYPHPTIPGLRVISLRGRIGGRLLMVEQVVDDDLWTTGGDQFRGYVRGEMKRKWADEAVEYLLDHGDLHWVDAAP